MLASESPSTGAPPNAEEFTRLYAECQERLFIYISLLMPNTADAHDVLQDTNLVLWQKFEQFEPGTSFFAWAREVARYRVLRYRQIHARDCMPVQAEILDAVAERVSEEETRQLETRRAALGECLKKLTAADRQLIESRYAPGASVKQIAQQSNRSENAISQTLGRIRRILRECVRGTLGAVAQGEEP